MPLEPGTTLGPYTVTAKIGEGGMDAAWIWMRCIEPETPSWTGT